MSVQILLVDDDEFARSFARTVLQRSGYIVHESEDVVSAIASTENFTPNVVVTDWNLSEGDGGDLARRLHDDLPHLPVILLTGDSGVANELSAEMMRQFSVIIYKPYSPSALEKAVQQALAL